MRGFLFVLILAAAGAACSSSATKDEDIDGGGGDSLVTLKHSDGYVEDYGDAAGADADVASEDVLELVEEEINGFNYPCEPLTVESCVTACGSAGKHKCVKLWGPCIPP